jgi:uncharacterized protein (DUF488 family)
MARGYSEVGMSMLFTIGFTQKNAETFFGVLKTAGVRRVVDVRLHNTGQLAGFTKRDDLPFFLGSIADADYIHLPMLAPAVEMLRAYRNGADTWETYARKFTRLLQARHSEKLLQDQLRNRDCLLCSEPGPEQCHRRLVAEYLQEHAPRWQIVHL